MIKVDHPSLFSSFKEILEKGTACSFTLFSLTSGDEVKQGTRNFCSTRFSNFHLIISAEEYWLSSDCSTWIRHFKYPLLIASAAPEISHENIYVDFQQKYLYRSFPSSCNTFDLVLGYVQLQVYIPRTIFPLALIY